MRNKLLERIREAMEAEIEGQILDLVPHCPFRGYEDGR